MRPLIALALLTSLAIPGSVDADRRQATPTRLLRTPSISATHVAFAYANNIWIVERKGGDARRLTSFQGQSSNPKISPDGTTVAFSADYAGNTDVYTVPVSGGEPERLTWHPGADTVQGWTPDGTKIMFASGRQTVGAECDAAVLDGAGEGRHRGADAVAARLSGQDFARRPAHRVSHEHLVGRGAPQLSRRPEPPGVDRRSQVVRSRLAAVDRFEGRRSGVAGRHGVFHFRSRRHRQRVVVRHRHARR